MAREKRRDGTRPESEGRSRAAFRPRLILALRSFCILHWPFFTLHSFLCCLLPTAYCLLLLIAPAWGEESLETRRERIENMSVGRKAELAEAQSRFERLGTAEKEGLRELARQIEADPDREELRRVMARYYAWVKELPAYTRAELLEGSSDARIDRVKKILTEHAKSRARHLSPHDVEVLRRWIETYRERYVKSLDESERKRLAGLGPMERNREIAGQVFRRWIAAGGANAPDAEKTLADLGSKLSPRARGYLESQPPEQQWWTVAGWIRRHGGMGQFPRPRQQVESDKLPPFFEQLNRQQQEYLLNLPGEEMESVLEEMYRAQQAPRIQGFRPGGPRGPMPPDMPGPGPDPGPPRRDDWFPGPPGPEEPPPRDL